MKRSMPSIIQYPSNRHSATIRNEKRWWQRPTIGGSGSGRRIQRLGDEEQNNNKRLGHGTLADGGSEHGTDT